MSLVIDGNGAITGLTTTGISAVQQLPAGSVLQVVQGTTQTEVTNSTNVYADTGLTVTITPKFASSKILIMVSQSCYKGAGNTGNSVNIKIFRGATDLGRVINAQTYNNTSGDLYSVASINYLDSPATTTSLTYKTQFANLVNAALVGVQKDNNGLSTITLMEIAA
jgi:hypothetical protein